MPFICAGQGGIERTGELICAVARPGVPVVEVGIPFSDPIADGPTIAAAMHEALEAGVKPGMVFEQVRAVRDDKALEGVGLVAMVSVSIVHRWGAQRFITAAKEAGFDGFIFPDAPVEESDDLLARVRDAGMVCSLLVSPMTPDARVERIVGASSGFVYALTRLGITGSQAGGPGEKLRERVALIRAVTALPIACGFGISSAEHVRSVVHAAGADAAIVGSEIVRRVGDAQRAGEDVVGAAAACVRDLLGGLRD